MSARPDSLRSAVLRRRQRGDRRRARRPARPRRGWRSSKRDRARGRAASPSHRELEGGAAEVVRVGLPALLTIQTGINEPRYATLRAIKRRARSRWTSSAWPTSGSTPPRSPPRPARGPSRLRGSRARRGRLDAGRLAWRDRRANRRDRQGRGARMSGVLVLAEIDRDGVRPGSAELIGAGRALAEQGAGPLTVALVAADADSHTATRQPRRRARRSSSSPVAAEHFEAHVAQAALEATDRGPRAGASCSPATRSTRSASRPRSPPAAATASPATSPASSGGSGALRRAPRRLRRQAASPSSTSPARRRSLLLLRAGRLRAGARAAAARRSPSSTLDLGGAARSEHVELREAPSGDVDITKADFLLSIGRGVDDEERIPELRAAGRQDGGDAERLAAAGRRRLGLRAPSRSGSRARR